VGVFYVPVFPPHVGWLSGCPLSPEPTGSFKTFPHRKNLLPWASLPLTAVCDIHNMRRRDMKRIVGTELSLAFLLCIGVVAWAGVDFPAQMKGLVPVYPGATVLAVMNVQNGSQVVMETGDASDKVITFYRQAMEEKGWTLVADMKQQNVLVVIFSKGSQMLQVGADSSAGKSTKVVLHLSKQ